MASKADLDLAKKLLSANVLSQARLRAAFERQAALEDEGRSYPLERILYASKALPVGSLDVLSAPSPLESQPFASYRLDGVLGEGGSSTVYSGVYLPNDAPVAVKVLDPIQALRGEFLERFQQEARMLVQLEHENVVMGYECGYESGYHFFSMDLIDGLTVLEVIERRGHLGNQEALSIAWQVARALEYLHESGFLHRDIKPGNMMVDETGLVRLIDMGLVRDLVGQPREAGEETTTVGTVAYVSPEQARGRTDLDPRSDVYSLGLSLYHMVVGEIPFEGESEYEVMAKQIMSALDTQKLKQRRIAPELHYFVTKMTSKDRSHRFESVAEVAASIEGYLPDGIVPVDLGAPPVVQPAAPAAPPVVRPVAPPEPQPPVARPVTPPAPEPEAPARPPAPKAPRPTRRRSSGGPAPRRRRRR